MGERTVGRLGGADGGGHDGQWRLGRRSRHARGRLDRPAARAQQGGNHENGVDSDLLMRTHEVSP